MDHKQVIEVLERMKYQENEQIKYCEKKLVEDKSEILNFESEKNEMLIQECNEDIQALDIAIESLDNEWQTDTPKESGFYLVTNGANKVDIRKWDNGWYHDMYRRYTNEELKVVAWKKFEPYERKEQQNDKNK